MPFQYRSAETITKSLIDYYVSQTTAITDFNVGSKIRTLFESFAQEMEKFYQQAMAGLFEAIGAAVYSAFDFARQPAAKAYTTVNFGATVAPSVNKTILASKQVKVPGSQKVYEVAADAVLLSGQMSVDVRVVCTQAGAIGNTPAATITEIVTPIDGIDTVTNAKAVITGRDQETDEERKKRFTTFVSSIHRGDEAGIEYGAKTTKLLDDYGYISEYVARAKVKQIGTANVVCYIYNGEGAATADLIAKAQNIIDGYVDETGKKIPGWKAAGIPCQIIDVTLQLQTVQVQVLPEAGYTLDMIDTNISNAIKAIFDSLEIEEVLRVNALREAVGQVRGVLDMSIIIPLDTITPGTGYILALNGEPIITLMA
ncbi:MAG: baseplate J/gp47 family protein [Bacillota bacterium]